MDFISKPTEWLWVTLPPARAGWNRDTSRAAGFPSWSGVALPVRPPGKALFLGHDFSG